MFLQPCSRSSSSFPQFVQGLIGFVLTCSLAGCAGKPAAAPEVLPPAPVQLATTQEIVIGEWTELLGATQPLPNRSARITAAVEGRVTWLLDDPAAKNDKPLCEGQRITKGKAIGQLDDRLVRANMDKLKSSLAETLELKRQSELGVKAAQLELNNLKALSGTAMNPRDKLVTQVQVDKAQIVLDTAQSKQKETEEKCKGIEEEIKALKDQFDLYVLRAPITGRLGAIQAVPGQTLAIGAIVAEVIDLDSIDVLCFVPPYTAGKLALGQPVRLVSDQSDDRGSGKIEFIAVQAQPDTGSFAVKARFPNAQQQLRSGSVVRVEALTKPREPRITIPESALLEDQDPPSVVIVRGEIEEVENPETHKMEKLGTVRKVNAKIGMRDRRSHRVEILGLEDPETKAQVPLNGDVQFVVKGGQGLEGDSKEGDRIKLEEEEEE